ncbi:MAG: metallophosphoesterase, partial [Elusimicrobia bacterium]|nr:metallophosphoesterase [Elusimicrobiota bacterium]
MRRRISVFMSVLALLFLYTGLQVGRLAPALPSWAAWAATVAFYWVLMGWQALYRSNERAHDAPWFPAVAWSGAIATGLWATFMLLSLPVDLGESLRRIFLGGDGPTRGLTLALAGVACGTTAIGLGTALAGPGVREVIVPIDGLPQALEGLTIAQVSDLHVGPTIRAPYLQRMVDAIGKIAPDLIAVTGDLADGLPGRLDAQVAPLAGLRAPLGVYYVTGNHEYYWDAAGWIAKMAELGLTPLVNENRV